MANIKIPRKLFEKEIGKLDEKMQHKIAMFGTPLENFDNENIEIEVFPNRPDMLSYQGFKRSFLAFLGKKTGMKKYQLYKPEKDYKIIIDSSVKDVRPYTACAIVKGLKFNDEKIKEIIDIQEKLHFTLGRKRKKFGIGIYPMEKIKLPIIYKAMEPDKIKFIPLESTREMSGLQILQQHPTGKEYAHLLAGKAKFPVFIDSDKNFLSIPPIINSQMTGKITEKTKDVFIECSGFDFDLLKRCINIIITTLADMDGKVYQMELKGLKKITPDLTPEKMKISLENTNKLLGLNINEKQLKQFIEKMGCGYSKGEVEIPAWRADILHEVDVIEDVAIAYGYDNFIPEIPEISTIGQENSKETIKRKISEVMAGINMIEVSNYHLTNKQDQLKKMGIQEKQARGIIELEESKTEYKILRKNLSHYLLKTFSENTDSEYPQRIFEIGRVFELERNEIGKVSEHNKSANDSERNRDTDWGGERLHEEWKRIRGVRARVGKRRTNFETDIHEKEHLAIALAPGNFTELKQIIEYLSRMIDTELKLKEPEKVPPHFIDGRCAEVLIEEKSLGFLGEIHPKILKNWKIKMPVALCEVDLEEIFEKLI